MLIVQEFEFPWLSVAVNTITWLPASAFVAVQFIVVQIGLPDAGSGGRHPVHVYPQLDGTNLVAIAQGETDEAIVVVAHHGTVRDSPGADDSDLANLGLHVCPSDPDAARRPRTLCFTTIPGEPPLAAASFFR